MKSLLLALSALILTVANTEASAIQFTTGGGRGHMFVSSADARIAAGSLVRVGYVTSAGNLATFQEFATTTISHPSASFQIGGFLTNPASSNTVATAAKGAQIYLWVYNAASAGAATEAGVFTSTDGSWVIPSGFTGDATETSNLVLSLTSGITAIADPTLGGSPSFARGTVTVGSGSQEGSIFKLGGAAVPEPSSLGLVALSLLGLTRRRR